MTRRVVTRNLAAILPFRFSMPEGWPSGLRRTLGKRVYGKPYRGFESHSLRHRTTKSLREINIIADFAWLFGTKLYKKSYNKPDNIFPQKPCLTIWSDVAVSG